MRLTNILCRQHIGWHKKMKWLSMKHRTIQDYGQVEQLRASGINVTNGYDDYMRPKPLPEIPVEFQEPIPASKCPLDENHPHYNQRACHIMGDSNVLIFGKRQAQVLTKTLTYNGLPENITNRVRNIEITPDIETQFKQSVMNAHLFDAHQEKLVKKKHPTKLMWVYKRDYGITDQRKNRFITDKLLQFCDKLSDNATAAQRQLVSDAHFVVPFEKDGRLFQFQKTADTLVCSKQPLKSIENVEVAELPDIYPLDSSISIDAMNIYQQRNVFPVKQNSPFPHIHTAFIYYTPLDVHNISREPVKEDQIESRALLKAFTFAAAKAQSIYGPNVKDLPEPITINCIHVHVNRFYFGVYQLNSLNLDGTDGIKNYWFGLPPMPLYLSCEYQEWRPILSNYTNDVLRHTLAFYQS